MSVLAACEMYQVKLQMPGGQPMSLALLKVGPVPYVSVTQV